jgi:eukaryotic-like serine/threonine-protein kinase
MVMGTPSYMAPEQTQGRCRDVGPHTDVYALGAILYEMLAGRPPFKTDSILETMEQVGSREPPPPSRFQPRVPRDLETICLKAMAKEPACRYRTALAFAEDLERFEAGGSILARREGTWARLWRKARRRRLITAAFLLVIAMTAGPGVFFYQRAARIQSLNEELEDGLEVREWTAAHLQKMEDVAVRLESINPEWSPWKVQRVHSRFARSIRDSLSQDSDLAERDIRRIEAALDVLARRDSTQAEELRQQLRTRLEQSHKKQTESGP